MRARGNSFISGRFGSTYRLFFCFLFSGLAFPAFTQSAEKGIMSDVLSVFDYADIPIQWTMNGESQAYFNEGLTRLKEKNFFIAIDQFTKAIEADRSSKIAHYYRAMANKQPSIPVLNETDRIGGRSISRGERIGNALDDILKFLEAYPDSEEGILEAGKIHILRKDPKDAVQRLKRFTKLRPKDARGPYYLGLAYIIMNEQDLAKKQFASCLEIDPAFVSGLTQLGGMEMIVEKSDEKALKYFDQVLQIDSMQWSARFFRYAILSKNKRDQEALADIDFMVRHNPANWRVHGMRATTRIQLESYREAFADLRVVMENTYLDEATHIGRRKPIDRWIDIQNVGNYIVRHIYGLPESEGDAIRKAFCLLVVARYDDCITSISSIEHITNQALTTYVLAVACEYADRKGEAEAYYNKAVELDPTLFDAHKKCGQFLSNRGLWKEAIPYYDAMERLNPMYSPTYRNRGIAFCALGEYDLGIQNLDKNLQMDSMNLGTFFYRGKCRLQQSKYLEALNDFVRSKRYDFPDYKMYRTLVDQLLVDQDSIVLKKYAELYMQIPSVALGLGYGVDFETTKVKLAHFLQDWTFINHQFGLLNLVGEPPNDPVYASYTMAAKGEHLMIEGYLQEALLVLNDAIKSDQTNSLAYVLRGKLWLKLKENRKATDDFEQAAKLGDKQGKIMFAKFK